MCCVGGGAIEEEDEPSSQTDNNGSLPRNESAPQLPQAELADVSYEVSSTYRIPAIFYRHPLRQRARCVSESFDF